MDVEVYEVLQLDHNLLGNVLRLPNFLKQGKLLVRLLIWVVLGEDEREIAYGKGIEANANEHPNNLKHELGRCLSSQDSIAYHCDRLEAPAERVDI